jgi:hypothetical protein
VCALQMAVIIVNMFVGPPLFRVALLAAGEARLYSSKQHDDEEQSSGSVMVVRIRDGEGLQSPL